MNDPLQATLNPFHHPIVNYLIVKVIVLRIWQLEVLVFSCDKQLRAAFMAVTVVTVLFFFKVELNILHTVLICFWA